MGAFLTRFRNRGTTETPPPYQPPPGTCDPLTVETKPRTKIQNESIPLRDELRELITQALSNGYVGRSSGQHYPSSCLFTSDGEDLIGHVSLNYYPKIIKLVVSEECVILEFETGDPIKFFPRDVQIIKVGKIDVLTSMLISRML